MLPREMMVSLLAEEQKEGERRGCHLVVVNGSSAHAVEKIEENTCGWVLIFHP